MKKFVFILSINLMILSAISGQDHVTLFYFDVSSSMTEQYTAIMQNVLLDKIQNRFTENSRFILRSFSDSIADVGSVTIGKQSKRNDIFDIIRKIFKQGTFGAYTDLGKLFDDIAIQTTTIKGPDKTLVIVTDGRHEPTKDSVYDIGLPALADDINKTIESAKQSGWDILVLKIPFLDPLDKTSHSTGEANTNNSSDAPTLFDYLDNSIVFDLDVNPADLSSVTADKLVDQLTNNSDKISALNDSSSSSGPDNNSNNTVNQDKQNDNIEANNQIQKENSDSLKEFEDGKRNSSSNLISRIFFFTAFEIPGLLFYILLFVISIFVILAIGLNIRKHMDDIREFFYLVSTQTSFKNIPMLRPIEMFAHPQKTKIGKRNIHHIPEGKKAYIGGKNSLFLIFIASFPKKIAELHHNNDTYTLRILKKDFFPDAEDWIIEDCLGKAIKAVPYKGQAVVLDFHEYIPQAEIINEFMRKVRYKRPENISQDFKN